MAQSIPPKKRRLRTKHLSCEFISSKENESESENKLSILNLPNEIIFQIFSYLNTYTLLTRIKLVCKSWKDLVRGSSLWKSFRYLSFDENENISYIIKIIEKCPNLRHLMISQIGRSFDYDKEPIDPSLFVALTTLPQLRSFSLNNFKIGLDCEESFQDFIKGSTYLSHLDLDKCYIINKIAEPISEARNLKFLCLSRCYSIDNQTFIKIFQNCNQLEHLNLSQQDTLNDKAFTALFNLLSGTLKSLMLRDISVHNHNFNLIEKCSNLSVLNIDCHFLVDKTLNQIKRLPHLKHLELSYGLRFTSFGLRRFFGQGSFSELKYLDLTCCAGLEDSALEVLADKCRELNCLDLAECWRVTDKGIYHVICKCTKLRLLNLEDLKELKGRFLSELHDYLKFLKVLNLCFCDGINIDELKKFVELNPDFKIKQCNEYRFKPVINPNFQPVLFISQGMKP